MRHACKHHLLALAVGPHLLELLDLGHIDECVHKRVLIVLPVDLDRLNHVVRDLSSINFLSVLVLVLLGGQGLSPGLDVLLNAHAMIGRLLYFQLLQSQESI